MIRVTITSTGTFINKPKVSHFDIVDESYIAVRRRDDVSNKTVQFSVGELYDAYARPPGHFSISDKEGASPSLFTDWVSSKYFAGRSMESGILKIEYTRI